MRNQYFLKKIIYFLIIFGTVFCITDQVCAAVKIVAFGDSITTGYPYLTGFGDGCQCPTEGYEVQLEEQMGTAGYDIEVYNYGDGGETTEEGLLRIGSVLLDAEPDYVLLLEGTNDLYNSTSVIVEALIDNLSEMIEMVLDAGAIPVLATLTPDTTPSSGPSKKIPQANDQIKDLWEQKVQEDKNVLFTDLYAAVVDDWGTLNDDLLHPNEEGYGVIAETWANTLLEVLKLVEINTSGDGQGSVSYNSPDGDCTTCSLTVPTATEVTLEAISADGSVFTGWLGECEDQGRSPVCVLTVNNNMSVTANFDLKFKWSLFIPAIIADTK